MTDLRYHTLNELKALSLEELRVLWEQVPVERQRSYHAIYERDLEKIGANHSDLTERAAVRQLVRQYAETGTVPLGMRWIKTPLHVREAAQANRAVGVAETENAPASKPSKAIAAGFGALIALLLGFLLLRGTSSNSSADATPDRAATQTALTATPLALEAQDSVITGGDSGRETFYPVNLQITLPDDETPRVWVVQRRTIRASQWYYDADPDTASYLSGMVVRPVVGIPWSEENAAWFAHIGEEAAFNVQMNTGAILRYEFEARENVRRSDTGIFRQVSPGLVLLLLGETDADGLPTATRTLILARYPVDQELARGGALVGAFALPTIVPTPTLLPTATPTPEPFAGLQVDLYRVTYGNGQITTYLRLYNGNSQPMTISPDDITLTLGYNENPVGAPIPAERLLAFDLVSGQEAEVMLVWVWGGEPYGSLALQGWCYNFQF